ncbi:SAM domain-containing protein SAMSN-1b [Cololabis saira]|uniref:SAM domain-containing protein SAMSN-1b n=1 Tax=Cololabis saira TaxID=129043 RepID=UPI002AD5702F|nr:SAM domain-containing protein SAMSN-1b [Cololabis saira]
MNLFCFTLEGSTESIYEPAHSQTLKQILPSKHQCSPAPVRHKYEWGGSDPSINSDQPQSIAKLKSSNRRSGVPTSALENETLDADLTCWMSPDEKSVLHNQKKEPKRTSSRSSVLETDDKVKDRSSERTRDDLAAKCGETTADAAESIQTTGRLKKLQNLVKAKKRHQSDGEKVKSEAKRNDCLAEVVRSNNAVLTCISLGRRTETRSSSPATSPQDLPRHHARGHRDDGEEAGVWSPKTGNHFPFDCSQPWAPLYHTCQQRRHEMWPCGVNLSVPRPSDWDRFESLLQELDSKQSALSPPQGVCPVPDLQHSHNPEKQEENDEVTKLKLQRKELQRSSQSDGKNMEASPEKTRTLLSDRGLLKDDAERREAGHGTFPKGHQQRRNSLESLYSLHSGQSSSSGVASGSDCSSNRDSIRLEDDLSFTKQFCGRARVHTEYVPSPYDAESLQLKVGDVIDIIAKPPMGIWKGILNGKVGHFKFIYVDVVTEPSYETHIHEERHKSTVQEMLKSLSLEEYSSPLQLSGYQTVEDLTRLKEHDLIELNVTDPEHRQRLLAAIKSLQQLCSERWLENDSSCGPENFSKDVKVETNNCPRDSGCLVTSESPDDCTEETEPRFLSEQPRPADTAAS